MDCFEPLVPEDAARLREFYGKGLEAECRGSRYGGGRDVDGILHASCEGVRSGCTVGVVGVRDGRIVGEAVCVRGSRTAKRGEVAVAITKEMRGKGLSHELLRALAFAARAQGVQEFHAYVDPDNWASGHALRSSRSGFTAGGKEHGMSVFTAPVSALLASPPRP